MGLRQSSEACARNRGPILEVLRGALSASTRVLEVGSGTGEHAAFFAGMLPHLQWQPTDVVAHLPGIAAWRDAVALPNLRAPLELDVDAGEWPVAGVDAVFTANTLHILSWQSVIRFFRGVGRVLQSGGVLVVYGPFSDNGYHAAESNARFDAFLRGRDPQSGLRDWQAVDGLAKMQGLSLSADHSMPANNRILIWRRIV
jgi:SAM-dependent methyltransferase